MNQGNVNKAVLSIVLAIAAVLISCYLIVSANKAAATDGHEYNAWKTVSEGEYGECETDELVCGENEGIQTRTNEQECYEKNGRGSDECKIEKKFDFKTWKWVITPEKRSVDESRSCTFVDYSSCEEAKYCPTKCGMEASEVPDGEGGYLQCEATPVCEVPVVPENDDDIAKANARFSDGPHGVRGDGKAQIEWKKIGGSSNVEIRISEDCVFGNGYRSLKTEDDGAYWLTNIASDVCVKVRGINEQGPWSDVFKVRQ